MANITASMVNELRKRTGVGMMDCKKALQENDGDMEKAIDYLRQKGQQLASKRSDRDASEACVLSNTNADKSFAALLRLNCETDFVAINEDFIEFTRTLLNAAIEAKAKSLEEINALEIDGNKVENLIIDQIAKIGEKIELSTYEYIEAPATYAYVHPGNRLATIIGLNKTGFDEEGRDIAMQVAAMAPVALTKETVSQEVIDREMEVYRAQVIEEGRPENLIDKIAEGKLNRFFRESTLLSQDFIKDTKKSVEAYLKESDKELTVTDFRRTIVGE